ncbi:MAG: hypothetical protein QOE22_719 [Candidatus Parcubacteria bacterium]|jgi:hypothetical protein|nr:hypothetical protein [Candidatus Parcubacteria bacterium]
MEEGFKSRGGIPDPSDNPWSPAERRPGEMTAGELEYRRDEFLKEPHYIQDSKGHHLGRITNILSPDDEIVRVALDDGEEIEYGSGDPIQVHAESTRMNVENNELKVRDCIIIGSKMLYIAELPLRVGDPNEIKVILKDGSSMIFYKDDPEYKRLNIIRTGA